MSNNEWKKVSDIKNNDPIMFSVVWNKEHNLLGFGTYVQDPGPYNSIEEAKQGPMVWIVDDGFRFEVDGETRWQVDKYLIIPPPEKNND